MPRFREGCYSRVKRLVETKLAGAGHKTAGETVHRVFKRVQGYSRNSSKSFRYCGLEILTLGTSHTHCHSPNRRVWHPG